jgi:hypothetical protein
MPTLVAVRVAPMKACTYVLADGSSHALTAQPKANGTTTPSSATSRDESPTFSICPTVDSRPTSKSRISAPIPAMISIVSF